MGIPEQQWETYDSTKQRVQDSIVSALKSNNDSKCQQNIATAQNTDITYCTHVGRYQLGKFRPINLHNISKKRKTKNC